MVRALSDVLLGLDIGTSVVKAAVFDREGREAATASSRTTTLTPFPAWSEADPDQLWDATCGVIRSVLQSAGVAPADVAAVGISGAMVGAWIIDDAGMALRPGIFWNDGRTQKMIAAMIAEDAAFMSRIFAVSGSVMQQGCTLPLLRWLKHHEPAVLAKAHAVFGAKDYIRFRLTGLVGTDITEAAVAPGSAVARGRSAEMIALFGLEDIAQLLPPPSPSESLGGIVTEAASRATGLRAGTPVAIGAGDVACSVIGAGALAPGVACSILGTTCLNGVAMPVPVFTPPDLGLLFTLPGDLWLRTMVNIAGTTNIDWLLTTLCPDLAAHPDPYAALAVLAAESPPGAQGAVYVPYLSDVGIIAPIVAPAARGGFAGLMPRHRRSDLVRAVYEGVAFAIRDCFATIGHEVGTVRLVGGGARSAFWRQLIADVLGCAVEVPVGQEFGAKGAALLAGTAIGWFADIRGASIDCCEILHRHTPQTGVYDAAFARYRLYAAALAAVTPPDEEITS
jgi:sugar (pentulose or hexulose) kinase